MLITALLVFIALVMAGYFTAAEAALDNLPPDSIRERAGNGDSRAILVRDLLARREELSATLFVFRRLCLVLAVIAIAVHFLHHPDFRIGLLTLLVTTVLIVLAEFAARSYGVHAADGFAFKVAPTLALIQKRLSGLGEVFKDFAQFLLGLFGHRIDGRRPILTAPRSGVAPEPRTSGDMTREMRDLDLITLENVMIHRRHMMALDRGLETRELIRRIAASPYTRIPLWKDNPDNIIGIINAKDVLRAIEADDGNIASIDIDRILSDPWFVPETTTLREQLNAFRERRSHFALVVDEYGALMGLITLEDILEEIVGDIADEYDEAKTMTRRRPDGSVIVDGSMTIRDLNRDMDWALPDEDATSIGGLVLHIAEHIPRPGEAFETPGYRLEVLRCQGNRVSVVRVTELPPPTPSL